jgi:hypothetical protein
MKASLLHRVILVACERIREFDAGGFGFRECRIVGRARQGVDRLLYCSRVGYRWGPLEILAIVKTDVATRK